MANFDFLTGAFLMAVFAVFCVVISVSLLADANAAEPRRTRRRTAMLPADFLLLLKLSDIEFCINPVLRKQCFMGTAFFNAVWSQH